MSDQPKPPFPKQKQPMPGWTAHMDPSRTTVSVPTKGSGRLTGKRAVITGGDSDIGRAVALAFAREGADLLIAYLREDEDAQETRRLVEEEGRRVVVVSGDLQEAAHCRKIVETAVADLGGIDILVNNAAHQASFKEIGNITDEDLGVDLPREHSRDVLSDHGSRPAHEIWQFDHQYGVDQFRHAAPHASRLCDHQRGDPEFHGGIGAAPCREGHPRQRGRARTDLAPLIPSTMPQEAVVNFGKQVPMKRPGQPAELVTTYVMLADTLSSYVSGATIAVTGKPIL